MNYLIAYLWLCFFFFLCCFASVAALGFTHIRNKYRKGLRR